MARTDERQTGSHWPMLDRPDEVTALILDWLTKDDPIARQPTSI
jgi:hypothetical protein